MIGIASVLVLGTASLGGYFLVSYLKRGTNHQFEAITISSTDQVYPVDNDLGLINPGEKVTQQLSVTSVISQTVLYSVAFDQEETAGLSDYLSVSLAVDGKETATGILSDLAKKDTVYSKDLPSKASQSIVLTYTLLETVNRDYLGNTLDFKINISARNRTLFG